jgi:hypothetical protein
MCVLTAWARIREAWLLPPGSSGLMLEEILFPCAGFSKPARVLVLAQLGDVGPNEGFPSVPEGVGAELAGCGRTQATLRVALEDVFSLFWLSTTVPIERWLGLTPLQPAPSGIPSGIKIELFWGAMGESGHEPLGDKVFGLLCGRSRGLRVAAPTACFSSPSRCLDTELSSSRREGTCWSGGIPGGPLETGAW